MTKIERMTAKEFIQEHTNHCSNELSLLEAGCLHQYSSWITPDKALRAIEIAREELIDKAIKWLYEHREEIQTEDNGIAGWISDEFIMDFKQAMEE